MISGNRPNDHTESDGKRERGPQRIGRCRRKHNDLLQITPDVFRRKFGRIIIWQMVDMQGRCQTQLSGGSLSIWSQSTALLEIILNERPPDGGTAFCSP